MLVVDSEKLALSDPHQTVEIILQYFFDYLLEVQKIPIQYKIQNVNGAWVYNYNVTEAWVYNYNVNGAWVYNYNVNGDWVYNYIVNGAWVYNYNDTCYVQLMP